MVSSMVGMRTLYRAISCSNFFCSVSDSLSEQCDTSESRVWTNHFMSSRFASTSRQMLCNSHTSLLLYTHCLKFYSVCIWWWNRASQNFVRFLNLRSFEIYQIKDMTEGGGKDWFSNKIHNTIILDCLKNVWWIFASQEKWRSTY
jgi:hypothetical protein